MLLASIFSKYTCRSVIQLSNNIKSNFDIPIKAFQQATNFKGQGRGPRHPNRRDRNYSVPNYFQSFSAALALIWNFISLPQERSQTNHPRFPSPFSIYIRMTSRMRTARSLMSTLQRASRPQATPQLNSHSAASARPRPSSSAPSSGTGRPFSTSSAFEADTHAQSNGMRASQSSIPGADRAIAIGLAAHTQLASDTLNLFVHGWDEFDDT